MYYNYKKNISVINKLPKRSDFVDDKLRKRYEKNINNNKDIIFMPSYVKLITRKFNGISNSVLQMTGTTIHGEKIQILANNIDIYFDLFLDPNSKDYNNKKLIGKMYNVICGLDRDFEKIKNSELIEKNLFGIGYHEDLHKGYRFYFYTDNDRKEFIKIIKKNYNYFLASDDISHTENKICREYNFTYNNWCYVKNYEVVNNKYLGSKCKYNLLVDINNIESVSDDYIQEKELSKKVADVIMTWDIETYTNTPGEINHEDDSNILFMICGTVHYGYSRDSLWSFCIVDKETDKCDDKFKIPYDTIIAGSESNIVKIFCKIFERIQPDFIIGFNDSMFDWLSLFYKAKKYDLLVFMQKTLSINYEWKKTEKTIIDYYWRKVPIKYDADTTFYKHMFVIPGCIQIDLSTEFRKLYPKAEVNTDKSLSFYLTKNNLDGKEDMTYVELWKIYERGLPNELQKVAEYCVIDALRCQDLQVVRNRIAENREVANLSYVKLYNAFYNADGMKVVNLLISYGIKHNYVFQTTKDHEEKVKYPGAFVVEPILGLNIEDPMTGVDFSSLYPSLMMAYNLSPEKIIYTEELANYYKKLNYDLHYIDFDDKNGENHRGWCVRHNNNLDNMGIFPSILLNLFNKRKGIKKLMAPHFHYLEEIAKDDDYINIMETKEYKDHLFWYNYYNAKQLALKIYMNTFYGTAGDCRSCIYDILVAGGTTSAGQYNIKMVYKFVVSKGYKVMYGDTDSLYITAPEHYYNDIRDLYKNEKITRLEYWTKLVERKMEVIKEFNSKINECLANDNGTNYLRMAYEEVLFPYILCGKKKYAGIPHEDQINFKIESDKQIFIRGLECKKRGQTNLSIESSYRILRNIFDYNNYDSVIDIIYKELDFIYNTDWDISYFIQKATYKPHKDNKKVNVFVDRMKNKLEYAKLEEDKERIELYHIPEVCEKFPYVIALKPNKIDARGRKVELKIGEKMEYPDVLKKFNMKIDFTYYIEKQFVGIISRFCSYYPKFHEGIEDNLKYKKRDEKIIKNAKKYFINYCKQYHEDINVNDKVINNYKKIFRESKNKFIDVNKNKITGGFLELFKSQENKIEDENLSKLIHNYYSSVALKYSNKINLYKILNIDESNVNIYNQYYLNKYDDISEYLNDQVEKVKEWFDENLNKIEYLFKKYKNRLYKVVLDNRNNEDLINNKNKFNKLLRITDLSKEDKKFMRCLERNGEIYITYLQMSNQYAKLMVDLDNNKYQENNYGDISNKQKKEMLKESISMIKEK